MSSATPILSADTPAARLRALLSRVPNSSSRAPPTPAPVSSSEIDSDFDAPQSGSATPSMARESLKDLFSRALRDPGDTPQKGRPRRNSIDTSEVEASPRVEKERANHKGKRRSLSDDELELPSKSSRSEASFKSSQASTFDNLRARLTNSHAPLKNQPPPSSPFQLHSESEPDVPADSSTDTATFLRGLNSSQAIPPVATSTPQRSLQMSTMSQFQSNLLEQDSEMQMAMKELESYDLEGESGPNRRPLPFPTARTSNAQSTPGRSHPNVSQNKTHSYDKTQLARQGSKDLTPPSSGTSSSLSGAEYRERRNDEQQERIREREREWNKRSPKTNGRTGIPEVRPRHSFGSASPVAPSPGNLNGNGTGNGMLSRKESITSMRSFDDDMSSRASSFGSQAEYRERINELERERIIEREREWNKRLVKAARPSSSLSIHSTSERTRTLSYPNQPESPHALLSPDHHRLRKQPSFTSSRSSSRNSSLALEDELPVEIVLERERNWNAPRPRWHRQPSHGHSNSLSPMPSSPTGSASSHTSPLSNGRVRSVSLRAPATAKGESPVHHDRLGSSPSGLPNGNNTLRAKVSPPRHGISSSSPIPHPELRRPASYAGQSHSQMESSPHSPIGQQFSNKDLSTRLPTPTSTSRLSYHFPRSHPPLSPIELDKEPMDRSAIPRRIPSSPTQGSRPPSRASGSFRISHIPVRASPKKVLPGSTPSKDSPEGTIKGRKRGASTSIDAIERTLPRIEVESDASPVEDVRHDELISETDEESLPQESTPTIRTVLPPAVDNTIHHVPTSRSPSPRVISRLSSANNDEARLQKVLASPPAVVQALSPPPSPPSDVSSANTHVEPASSVLSTPPRRSSFSSSRVEFQTPSPPKGLPELPGPPSSSEDDERVMERTPLRYNDLGSSDLTAMKTPKPPGAWTSTPTPARPTGREAHPRAQALSEESDDSRYDSGLATPVASLSRATAMSLQTPAPPGAWLATPAPRKSILKVRFDTESSAPGHSIAESAVGASNNSSSNPEALTASRNMNGSAKPSPLAVSVDNNDYRPRTPTPTPTTPVPASVSPRRHRKSPSIRVVDAFGRETFPEEHSIDKVQKGPNTSDAASKSIIRIVDAMGREVTETVEPSDYSQTDEDSVPLEHNEALTRVRRGLADLAEGLSDMDKSGDQTKIDQGRLDELDDVSRVARETRTKLSQTLQMAQNSEDNLRSKFGSLRASMKKSKFLPSVTIDHRSWANAWVLWGLIFLQLFLVLVMYRFSVTRARQMFLTTYYDPFYPDLHLYPTKPETSQHTISIFSIAETLQRDGWRAVTGVIWNNCAAMVADAQKWAWDTWGYDELQRHVPWPPT